MSCASFSIFISMQLKCIIVARIRTMSCIISNNTPSYEVMFTHVNVMVHLYPVAFCYVEIIFGGEYTLVRRKLNRNIISKDLWSDEAKYFLENRFT